MKSFKCRLFVLLCFVLLFMLSLGFGMLLAQNRPSAACYAVLYPYEGYIGVYASRGDYQSGKLPLEVIKTEISLLPDADKTALQSGIILNDRETLGRYIEDFELVSFHFLR